MIKSSYKVIGVMSGTSLDGIDIIYATYRFDNQWNFEIHDAKTIPYSKYWKSILSQLVSNTLIELQSIDKSYSKYLANVILDFIKTHEIRDIDFVSSHGHTALHQPNNGLTLQIGNLQILADILNQNVICDFRIQDVELGGQGAPLVPIGDRQLFYNFDFCLNLGGFANISFENKQKRIAYDICPVNIVLNHYVAKLNLEYDDRGQLAEHGIVNEDVLLRLNDLDFYNQKPPKSLGLEWVKEHVLPLIDTFSLKIEDILRTFVEHIAVQISKTINKNDKTVLVTGGGVYNDFLISRIQALSNSKIMIPSEDIIEFKEALVFGLLGVLKQRNEVNCLKSVTGAKEDHSSGKILMPNTKINL